MEKDEEFVFIETDFATTYREFLKVKYKWRTFPIVIQLPTCGSYKVVGGYDDLVRHLKEKPKNEGKDIVTICNLKSEI